MYTPIYPPIYIPIHIPIHIPVDIYISIPLWKIEHGRKIEMNFEEKEKKFHPEEVYKGQPNPTKI